MRQLDQQSNNPSSADHGDPTSNPTPNAFSPDFLAELTRRDPSPATPEADLAGPWRVTALYGASDPRWACLAAGERQPRLTLQAPDLAHLSAAALALADHAPTFQFQEAADHRPDLGWHLLWNGQPVGTVPGPVPPGGDTLPLILTALAHLRTQPLPFAHYLLSAPDETLRRAGAIALQLLQEAGR